MTEHLQGLSFDVVVLTLATLRQPITALLPRGDNL
jgi:hypothetical protein